METNKKLQRQQQQLENCPTNFNTEELRGSIVVACQRTLSNIDKVDLDLMIDDIANEFKMLNQDDILKAIRNGSLGKNGKTYKLSTQEVCIWIRTYANEMDLDIETPQEKIDRKMRDANRF